MLKTNSRPAFLSSKKHTRSGANSNTFEILKMQIIHQFENGEKTWNIFQF